MILIIIAFFDADQVESVVMPQTQQRMALDTVSQQNMFVFGTSTVREEQIMQTVAVQQQQQQQQNQWDQWQQQPEPQPQKALTVVVENDLLDLASESETKANNLTELYKQGPSPLLQMQIPLQMQTQQQPQLQLPYQSQPAPMEVDLMQAPAKVYCFE